MICAVPEIDGKPVGARFALFRKETRTNAPPLGQVMVLDVTLGALCVVPW
jgi:hypothetical protein